MAAFHWNKNYTEFMIVCGFFPNALWNFNSDLNEIA